METVGLLMFAGLPFFGRAQINSMFLIDYFRARIAFKLVWVPNENFDQFVLVDDDGKELARGYPTGQLPGMRQRQMNYQLVQGSKYAKVVDQIASSSS